MFKWLIITVSAFLGFFMPLKFVIAPCILVLLAYKACKQFGKKRLQWALSFLYGGLVTGAVVKLLIMFVKNHDYIGMVIAPFLIWLFSRALFFHFRDKYSLIPIREKVGATQNVATSQNTDTAHAENFPDWAREDAVPETHTDATGTSAWGAGDSRGSAKVPDETGKPMTWEFFYNGGEIAMGGPIYGDVVFSNNCAFSGVGPSVGISDDGHYAAMTQPSREAWGLIIADLKNKRAYQTLDSNIWEIDRIEGDMIIGRHSPLTSNDKQTISISQTIKKAKELPMVQDDGWWVVDFEGREPLPNYHTVTIHSDNNAHQLRFVPDNAPALENPYDRYSPPNYKVEVDNFTLDLTTRSAKATWVNGKKKDEVGRFLIIDGWVLDFIEPVSEQYNVAEASKELLNDNQTDARFDTFKDGGDGQLIATGIMLAPNTNPYNPEENITSHGGSVHPWDEEEVVFTGLDGKSYEQSRTQIERHVRYTIDLDIKSYSYLLAFSSKIELINRTQPKHSIALTCIYNKSHGKNTPYAPYGCKTSAGALLDEKIGVITEEAIWSNCGRYLAVVAFEKIPDIAKKIKIVDFEKAEVREIAGQYVMPNFIWFDEYRLDFTHAIALLEQAAAYNPWRQEETRTEVTDPAHKDALQQLLIATLDERRAAMDKKAAQMATKNSYASGSVYIVRQHVMLFAPDFDKAVLQPPEKMED